MLIGILKIAAFGPVRGYVQQVYPALHRLENRGLLAADWKETETGREAKFYRLNPRGRARLESEATSWQRLSQAVSLILRLSEGGARLPDGSVSTRDLIARSRLTPSGAVVRVGSPVCVVFGG